VTIKANNVTRILGSPTPAFSSFVSSGSVVGADTLGTPTYATTPSPAVNVGFYTITVSGLANTNYSISYETGVLQIIYQLSGVACLGSPGHTILEPVNADGSSVFNSGRTVPLKFRVCDVNGNSIGTPGVVVPGGFRLIQVLTGLTPDAVFEPDPAATNSFSEFRWSATDQQWIFNLNTKGLAASKTYYYRITLNDGTDILFHFGLR